MSYPCFKQNILSCSRFRFRPLAVSPWHASCEVLVDGRCPSRFGVADLYGDVSAPGHIECSAQAGWFRIFISSFVTPAHWLPTQPEGAADVRRTLVLPWAAGTVPAAMSLAMRDSHEPSGSQ